ncbi:hypothetical protein GTW37_16755 [Streptomyces sp. SID4931]|nr:hypothetical protein [Streptomyces sp. SID4931]
MRRRAFQGVLVERIAPDDQGMQPVVEPGRVDGGTQSGGQPGGDDRHVALELGGSGISVDRQTVLSQLPRPSGLLF